MKHLSKVAAVLKAYVFVYWKESRTYCEFMMDSATMNLAQWVKRRKL